MVGQSGEPGSKFLICVLYTSLKQFCKIMVIKSILCDTETNKSLVQNYKQLSIKTLTY